jgi:predicted helicase
VVSFIVNSVHELLQEKFGLEDGLASKATWGDVKNNFSDLNLPEGVNSDDPFICILDPATGTGTFLYECIELIEKTVKERLSNELKKNRDAPEVIDRWRQYVSEHLLPRIYGYELMMASYSIAHLKLAFKLGETGYKLTIKDRFHIYLTNSLEPGTDVQQRIDHFLTSLSKESKEVSQVKDKRRFTVIIGNPPYSRISQTKNDFIKKLIKDYKKPVAGEANQQPLDDDYIKFIRLAHHIQSQSGIGIIGYITNHTVLSGILFRGVRECLCKDQSSIHIVDLHGNSNIKELCPDGSIDENVFDILAGVSITLVSRYPSKSFTNYKFIEFWGPRTEKNISLLNSRVKDIKNNLTPEAPYYFLKPIDLSMSDEIRDAFSLVDIFPCYSSGLMTVRDKLAIAFKKDEMIDRFKLFRDEKISDENFQKMCPVKNYRKWTLSIARKRVQADKNWRGKIKIVNYRPFDKRYIYYSSDIVTYPNYRVMNQFIKKNIGLVSSRINKGENHAHEFVTREMVEIIFLSSKSSNNAFVFPLYINESTDDLLFENDQDVINLSNKFLKHIQSKLSKSNEEQDKLPYGLTPEDIFSYIYAVLHSQTYRSRYAELLKIDFPRVPITENIELFKKLSMIGKELISTHLLESDKTNNHPYKDVGEGEFKVEKIHFSNNTIWIDKKKTTGFQRVPNSIWHFYIGGYRVCEKWLKDRKNRILSKEDIEHYKKIIVSIGETIRLQTEIDKIIDEHGGWPGAFVTDKGGSA